MHFLKRHGFPALPEDVETAKLIAGRDGNGNKGALKPLPGAPIPPGVHSRGLVSIVQSMPVLVKEPGDADYEDDEPIVIVI